MATKRVWTDQPTKRGQLCLTTERRGRRNVYVLYRCTRYTANEIVSRELATADEKWAIEEMYDLYLSKGALNAELRAVRKQIRKELNEGV